MTREAIATTLRSAQRPPSLSRAAAFSNSHNGLSYTSYSKAKTMQATSHFEICHDCSQINFELAFRSEEEALRRDGQRWICSLSRRQNNRQARCSLCEFFSQVVVFQNQYRDLRAFLIGQKLADNDGNDGDDVVQNGVVLSIAGTNLPGAKNLLTSQVIINTLGDGNSSNNNVDWNTLRSWLEFCSSDHHTCRQSKSRIKQVQALKVIDCETLKVVELFSSNQQYATLSYVWGVSRGRGNVGNEQQINPANAPPLIMDAINTTKLLGIRYLWIDRYCIRQDDQEKHALIRNMGYIYANSCLTIITSCSDGPSQGISGVGERLRQQPWQPQAKIGKHNLKAPFIRVKQEVEGSLWNSRGWTYQEALLAPKRLVFTQSQVYFQCHEMHCFEMLGNVGIREPVALSSLVAVFPQQGVGSSLDDIRSRILEYSKRTLRFDTDTFRAISGVLQLFADKFGFRHLCGLPVCPIASRLPARLQYHSSRGCRWMESGLNNLVISLTWAFGYENEIDPPQPIRRRAFPSWSWVGWQFSNIATRFSLPGLPSQYAVGPAIPPKASVLQRPLHPETHRRYCNSYCLEPCAQVEVEFDDGVRLPWAGQEDDVLSHGDSENIPRLLHIRSWVAQVIARYVPALGRNVYPTWSFRLAPGGTIYCPSANQRLSEDIDPGFEPEDDEVLKVLSCPPTAQPQVVDLELKDGLDGVLEFAWAVNDIPSNQPDPVVPELLAVVMSACSAGLVALLVTPIAGTAQYEFCGVRRFRFYPAQNLEEMDIWPGEEDGPIESPFPIIGSDAFDGDDSESFIHHRIQFKWKEIVLA